jgi:flagellar basal-body rod modification protein FlgD
MQVNSTTAAQSYTAGASAAPATAGVDTGNFMMMLLAQLKNQNPMEPMKDGEMMGQMAQLNSLQELQMIKQSLQEMALSNQASYAASLIGKTVRAEVGDATIEGQVSGVTVDGSLMRIHIGDKVVTLDQVREIAAKAGADAEEAA